MSLTTVEARAAVLKNLPKGSRILGSTEEGDLFLFLVVSPDPLEGHLDPFFSIDKETGAFVDFSPQDYPNSRDILQRLQA